MPCKPRHKGDPTKRGCAKRGRGAPKMVGKGKNRRCKCGKKLKKSSRKK